MKKVICFILIVVLFILVVTMSGCTYAAVNDTDDDTQKNGTDLDGGYARISYHNYVQYVSGYYFAFRLTYDYDYYQKKKSTLNVLLNELGESFKNNGYDVSVNDLSGEMTASLSFKSTEEYLKYTDYNGFLPQESSYDSVEKKAFYIDRTSKSKTLFTDIDKEYKFIGRIYSVGCLKAGIDKNDVLLQYVYGTPYKEKFLKTNADQVVYSPENSIYLHIFNMNMDTRDREIILINHSPNVTAWYAVTIAAGVIVFAIPLTVYLLKRKKKE